jgi:3-demethoxyubiquinol 3-hydroxylase
LRGHLSTLPAKDAPSRVVLQAMVADEMAHAAQAQEGGGEALPDPLPLLMHCTAKIMTNLSHWW